MDAAGRAASGFLILAICGWASPADQMQHGAELAGAGRWNEARAAFLEGEREAPLDKHFPLELAGVEYRLKNFSSAKRHLRRALQLDPGDRYGNDFLGTIYFLEGNLEAALRYWSRIGKPQIGEVAITPEPRLNPVLLDSALAFAPGSPLTLDQLRTAEARLDALNVFASYRLELAARPDERFDANLHWPPIPGWMTAASALRGAAYQTVMPEARNIGGSGINWDALLRWDAQKRRAEMSLGGPLHTARWRYRWYADGRSETWNAGSVEDFRVQRLASGVTLQAIPSWRISWQTGVEVSSRHLMNLQPFPGGAAFKYRSALNYQIWRIPERRITVNSQIGWDLGRWLSGPRTLFSQAQASVSGRWLPQARGDDYEVKAQVRAGTTQGAAPFDELFILGVERDNDLWLRGHAGTIDGKKGSAPLGRNYFLANWDFHKQLYRHSFFTIAAGPFLDTGRTNDVFNRAGFGGWMIDAGLQGSFRVSGVLRITLSYGRDLRGGGHSLYATTAP